MNNLFAQVEPPVVAPWFLIAVLVGVALVLGASAVVSQRNKSWKGSLTQSLGSLLWASPVIAVLAFVGAKVAPQFQFGTEPRPAHNTKPTWLEEEMQVRDVRSFDEKTLEVSHEEKPAIDESLPVIDFEPLRDDSLPEWTSHKVLRLESTKSDLRKSVWRVAVESDWQTSVEEAKESVLAQTARLVQEDFGQFYPGASALSKEVIQDFAVRAEAVEEQHHADVAEPFTMYKVYWQVELSPDVREELMGDWKQEIAGKRAWLVGLVLALLTLVSASFAGYFHLDKKTGGAHRLRLKLAATALMTAGGLGALAVLPYV